MGFMDFINEVFGDTADPAVKEAAESGDINKQLELCHFYMQKILSYKQEDINNRWEYGKKLFKWSQKASAQGNVDGLLFLATCYNYNYGTDRDYRKAVEIYLRLVSLGRTDVFRNLAQIYENGGYGIDKDERKAIELYWKAVNLGDGISQQILGECYLDGKCGLSPDIQKAATLLLHNPSNCHIKWLKDVGDHLRYGIGTPKNDTLALECYKKAVTEGSGTAADQLEHTVKAVGPKVFGVQVGMPLHEAQAVCKGKDMQLIPDKNFYLELGTIILTTITFNVSGNFTDSEKRSICQHYNITRLGPNHDITDEYYVVFSDNKMEIHRLHPPKTPKLSKRPDLIME